VSFVISGIGPPGSADWSMGAVKRDQVSTGVVHARLLCLEAIFSDILQEILKLFIISRSNRGEDWEMYNN
jgi:hypothetical protein